MSSQATSSGKTLAWSLWAMTTFFYAFQYIIRVSPSIMLDDIMAKFSVNAAHMGDFNGNYYLGYALMHIPIGILLDRFGPRWTISVSVFTCVLGIVPLFYLESWQLTLLGRVLVGAGSSGAILGVFAIIRLNFPDNLFSRILGVSVMVGLAGAIYGGYPIKYLSQNYGWEQILFGLFVVGCFLSIAIAIFTPRQKAQQEGPSFLQLALDNKGALMGRVLLTALMAALMVGPLEGFADIWATSYLVHVYGYDKAIAASLPALIFIGMGVGSPLLAAVSERFKAYYPVTLAAALGMGIFFSAILLSRPSPWMVGTFFFIIGMLSAYQVLVMYMNSKNVDSKLAGIVTAFTNMVIMLFGWFFHKAITLVMDKFWDGKIENCVPIYSAEAYTYGLMVIPGALGIAFVGFFFLSRKAPIR